MTVDDVKKEVAAIRASKADYEAAHGMEDRLYVRVLEHIAKGGDNAKEIARAALRTSHIDFARYCA